VDPKDQIGENDTFSVKLVNHKKRKIVFPPGSAKAQIQENTVDKKKYVVNRVSRSSNVPQSLVS